MKLVASAIIRNEAGRYLGPWLDHLYEFCDHVVVMDDSSEDDSFEICNRPDYVDVYQPSPGQPLFDDHEGRARQILLNLTFQAKPTHVLAIDADEFVAEGKLLRAIIEQAPGSDTVWSIPMREIWELDGECLCQRQDGGWREHYSPLLYKAPQTPQDASWRIENKAMACGRVPIAVRNARPRALRESAVSVLHFGWTNEAEREARYERYMRLDGGRFHNRAHLESIKTEPTLVPYPWPESLADYREAITRRATNAVL